MDKQIIRCATIIVMVLAAVGLVAALLLHQSVFFYVSVGGLIVFIFALAIARKLGRLG